MLLVGWTCDGCMGTGLEQQIPCRNDRKKSKSNDEGGSGSFASLRMTKLGKMTRLGKIRSI